jgi:hypothetical protein
MAMQLHLTQLSHWSRLSRELVESLRKRRAPAPSAASSFDRAMDAYTQEHYVEAFGALSRLADEGHVDAARMALLMHQHGPRLFGHRFDIYPARRARWPVTAR